MKKIITIICIALVSGLTMAQSKNKKLSFEVDGVCQMCKMRIEKAALDVTGVKFAQWNIPSHELTLVIDERKTNTMAIKMALAEAGHDSKELKATQEAYEQVHACCRYRDIEDHDSMKHQP